MHSDIKGRVSAPQPRIGRAVICNGKSGCLDRGKVKHQRVLRLINSVHLSIVANQFCFETGCFVYHLDVLGVKSLKLQT